VLIKLWGRILTGVLFLPNLSQALEVKGVLEVNRLLIEQSPRPREVRVEPSQRCGAGTQELVLSYPGLTVAAAQGLVDAIRVENPTLKSCEETAVHGGDGTLKVIFAYRVPKGQTLQWQRSESEKLMTVDFWFGPGEVASRRVASQPRTEKATTLPKVIENLNDLAKIENIELRSFTNFDSPYRDPRVEKDSALDASPLKTRALSIPILQLRLNDVDVDFTEQEFPFKEFQLAGHKMSKGLSESVGAIIDMSKREDWIRASAANDLLLKSKLGTEYKDLGFFVPAFTGYLKLRAAFGEHGTQNNALFSGGINVWRETLLKQALTQQKSDPFLDFIYLESLRHLYLAKDYYGGLALIDEAKGIKWSVAVLERSDYLQGVALMSLGMRQKAKDSFAKYIESRKQLNIRDISDRRLLPSAAFRMADVDFARGDFAAALTGYESAMNFLPGTTKVNLEGYLYPRSLVSFPQVLFNMAEAHIRMGHYAKALKRLRALIAFDVAGTNHGIAMFRIAELLRHMGSDSDRILAILRECSYRYAKYLSGNLCEMHGATMEKQNLDRSFWPRLEASFTKFVNEVPRADRTTMNDVDKKMYASLVKAMFYIERDRPLIALNALDETRDLESANYLLNWNYEYSASAFLGVLREYLKAEKYDAVIAAYEKRRKTQLLYVERSGIALAASRAYADQGLWNEASRAYDRAEELKRVIARTQPRPFDYSPVDWAYTDAQIAVGLFDEGKFPREATEAKLKALDDRHVPSLALLIGFAQRGSNLPLEIRGWQRLSEVSQLDWTQLKSYTSALLKADRKKELRQVLETSVGTWFYDKDKSYEVEAVKPESSLLLRLAETRVKNGAVDSGIRVYEYLSKLDNQYLDPTTPREMVYYSLGKVQASKKDYGAARRSFDSATSLAPDSVWGRLAATENRELDGKMDGASAR
jgi:tetratricopeptide (TPR) repeat protein